ncbi:655_t:CDS:1, partial [Dentiscutata erythropus]
VLSEEHTSRLLGQQRLYLNVDLEDNKSSFIKNFQKSYLKFYFVFYLKKQCFTKLKKLFDHMKCNLKEPDERNDIFGNIYQELQEYPNEDVDKNFINTSKLSKVVQKY